MHDSALPGHRKDLQGREGLGLKMKKVSPAIQLYTCRASGFAAQVDVRLGIQEQLSDLAFHNHFIII